MLFPQYPCNPVGTCTLVDEAIPAGTSSLLSQDRQKSNLIWQAHRVVEEYTLISFRCFQLPMMDNHKVFSQ